MSLFKTAKALTPRFPEQYPPRDANQRQEKLLYDNEENHDNCRASI